jgi:hypothetical protein
VLQRRILGMEEPVERDTLYRPVERSESTFTVLV